MEVDRHGVIIDICPTCHGAWFDASELETITDYAARRLARLKIEKCGTDLSALSDSDLNQIFDRQFKLPQQTPTRYCPCDGVELQQVNWHGITVDWCPVCRGIWCDRGELDAIVHATAHQLALTRCFDHIEEGDIPWPQIPGLTAPVAGAGSADGGLKRPSRFFETNPQPVVGVTPAVLAAILSRYDEKPTNRLVRALAIAAIGAKTIKFTWDIFGP